MPKKAKSNESRSKTQSGTPKTATTRKPSNAATARRGNRSSKVSADSATKPVLVPDAIERTTPKSTLRRTRKVQSANGKVSIPKPISNIDELRNSTDRKIPRKRTTNKAQSKNSTTNRSRTKDKEDVTTKRSNSKDRSTSQATPTMATSLPEVKGADTIPRTSTPIPRVGPVEQTPLERFLNIKWSRFIPHTPTKKQIAGMLLANVKEVLFGGALGGGKSDWLAYEALRFCDLPGFSGILFRRQLTDLKQPGALIPRIANWLSPFEQLGQCRYSGDEHTWYFKTTFPSTDIPGPDARLQFGYIGEATVRDRYSSAEYQFVGFEELWQWPDPVDYLFMRSRIRKVVCSIHGKLPNGDPNYVQGCKFCDTLSQMPLRMRAATNPGPPWIKRRFGIIPDPAQFKNRHDALVAISEGLKVRWIGTNLERPFIPSYLDDNPHLDAKDYKEMLKEMNEDERSRLEDGNWEARRNARFKRKWQRFYQLNIPHDLLNSAPTKKDISYDLNRFSYSYCTIDVNGNPSVSEPIPFSSLLTIFTTVDTAVTVRKGPVDEQVKQKNSSAVISTWGVTGEQNLLWINCRKFRKEIPDLVENLVEVNGIWQPRFNKIECNGVGIGVAQYSESAGLPVRKNYRKTDKLENSLSAQIMMKAGRIWFPENANWLYDVPEGLGSSPDDDVFSWTGLPGEDDDVIDTLADAATEVAPGVAHEISAPTIVRGRPKCVGTYTTARNVPHYGLTRR